MGDYMKLKIIIGTGILVFLLLISTAYFFIKSDSGSYRSEVSVEECGDNYKKASEVLMKRYLSHYCSPLVGKSSFLTDYKIIKIDAYDYTNGSDSIRNQKDKYEFVVVYNVRMFTNNDWIAGNGKVGRDGWVDGKVAFGRFHKINNQYILDDIGTGP
jgi:hypothetical protein